MALEYGTKQAQIEEFYITDDRGVPTNAILKGTMFTIHMKVRFMDPIPGTDFCIFREKCYRCGDHRYQYHDREGVLRQCGTR